MPARTQRRTTKQRGLAGPHQSFRQAALRDMPEGEPCFRCELAGRVHPMTRAVISVSPFTGKWVAPLLELDEYPGRVYGGPQIRRLSWRKCNRRHGQKISTVIQAMRRAAAVPARYDRW